MAFFLPSFFQKRILRYALSRLDLFDTDALDLDRLDVVWGKKSTIELREVGLRLKQLSSLIHLPSYVEIIKARVLLLRITVPADIYSSGILIEVEGVEGQLLINSDAGDNLSNTSKKARSSRRATLAKGVRSYRSQSTQPAVQDPGGALHNQENVQKTDATEILDTLPSTVDLAQSFLQTEPAQRRAELQAAISKSQRSSQSNSSEEGEEDDGAGFGTALSLPTFIADFLQGVGDRLRLEVKRIHLDIDMNIDVSTGHCNSTVPPNPEKLTLRLSIESIKVENRVLGRGPEHEEQHKDAEDKFSHGGRGRCVSILDARCMILSDASLFNNVTQFSGPPSPVATHSIHRHRESSKVSRDNYDSKSQTSSSSAGHDMSESTILNATSKPDRNILRLAGSTALSDTSDRSELKDGDAFRLAIRKPASLMHESQEDSRQYQGSQDDSTVSTSHANVAHPPRHIADANAVQTSGRQSNPQISSESRNLERSGYTSNASLYHDYSSDEERKAINPRKAVQISNEHVYAMLPSVALAESICISTSDPNSPLSSTPNSDEDLTKSKIFSHEEVESLYMSAISQVPSSNYQEDVLPGTWATSSPSTAQTSVDLNRVSDRGVDPQQVLWQGSFENYDAASIRSISVSQENVSSKISTRSQSSSLPVSVELPAALGAGPNESPHTSSEDGKSHSVRSSQSSTRVAKQFFHLDKLTVTIPHDEPNLGPTGSSRNIGAENRQSVRSYNGIPGAFSDCDILQASTASVGLERSQVPAIDEIKEPHLDSDTLAPISIFFHNISLVGDMSLLRLMVMIAQHLSSLQPLISSGSKHESDSRSTSFVIALHIETLCWKFVDVVRGFVDDPSLPPHLSAFSPSIPTNSDVLLVVKLEEIDVVYKLEGLPSITDISVGKFEFGYTDKNIVEFDLSLRMRDSTHDILAPSGKDIIVSILKTAESLRISATTLPLHVSMDLARLDETLNWFGGLSTVLGLGSSMVSTVTMIEPRTKNLLSTTRKRGVHFDSPGANTSFGHAPNIQRKMTIRVGGVILDLYGKESALHLDSSALKLVSRDEGIGVQLDKVKFGGPYLRQQHKSPTISIYLDNIRIEYLPNPKEVDLARLLALLSPSRDRDDMDDDILLETLFRQRRQGAVLRCTVGTIQGNITRLNDLQHLLLISEELTKLSTVAKYLPEDDRPGILSLILVRKLRLQLQVNSKFGSADIISQNIEVAHVTLPSLTLLGINNLCIQHQDVELVGAVLSLDADPEQQIPMIMVRLVGDEMEPTIKFKMWNIRLEYHVSTLMAILGLSENANGEIIISDVVESIASLTEHQHPPKLASQSSQASEKSSSGARLLRFEVLIRDSVIGLNPRLSKSKGLFVLTNTTVVGAFPRIDDSELGGSFEIKKASLMVIDTVANIVKEKDLPDDPSQTSQVQTLSAMGYVGVSDISAAKITWRMVRDADGENSIDVEVRDELFVLETCADSTQTLQSVLSGLNPPMPPGQELKYRTEVVPVEDMLASFTGDAYSIGTGSERGSDDLPLGLDEGDMVDDDVPQNLEFVSSFYNPDPTAMAGDIANSILEGDFGTLVSPPVTRKIGDKRLLQSFREQYEVAPGSEPLNFDEEHFGTRSEADGRPRKWSSDQNTYNLVRDRKLRGIPLKLRVRDVHIIWNIFDGYDWQRTRDAIGQAVADVESKAAERLARKDKRKPLDSDEEEESVIGDFLFNSIYIGIPTNHDPRDLSRAVNRNLDDLTSEAESYATSTTVQGSPNRQGQMPRTKRKGLRLQRSKHHKMAFELKGVSVDLVIFSPSSGETQSSIDIRIQDLEIFDHVPTSTWKKFATYMRDAGERESGSSMVHIEIFNVRPIPELAASEIILKATVLPLRLHVDQDALDFMTRFFEFKDDSAPVSTSKSEAVFFQRAEVNSIQVKLDFKPKRVDYAGIRSGHTTEFMNFFILDQADMVLRHVIIYGVSGFEKLGKTLNDIWMPDIKRNQLPGVLAGLAPVRSLVNVGGGMKDLVVIPIREYRKDGRIIRSIQKGAFSFAKTTTTELAKLGAKIALGTQTVLQGAEDYLTQPANLDNWESADLDEDEKKHISLYADQPIGVMQGLRGAYRHLERDLLTAKDAIIAMPAEVMESGTAGGAARAVLRTAPTVILRPALAVTKAVGQTLLGATNSLDKGERRRVEDKYKRH